MLQYEHGLVHAYGQVHVKVVEITLTGWFTGIDQVQGHRDLGSGSKVSHHWITLKVRYNLRASRINDPAHPGHPPRQQHKQTHTARHPATHIDSSLTVIDTALTVIDDRWAGHTTAPGSTPGN